MTVRGRLRRPCLIWSYLDLIRSYLDQTRARSLYGELGFLEYAAHRHTAREAEAR